MARINRSRVWSIAAKSASDALAERGLRLIAGLNAADGIGGYYPIKDELNPLLLLETLHQNGFRIGLPKIREGLISFKEWAPGSTLCCGIFGTLEPSDTQPVVFPTAILVPLLAFDLRGNRLGYGAGYYDTALRVIRRERRVVAIGVGFDEQEMPEIPREPQDEPLDMILTPSRTIVCKA
jgi:5-formyltetrahydrofolate cyclo-ligase